MPYRLAMGQYTNVLYYIFYKLSSLLYNNFGDFMNIYKNCTLCPRNCKVNRYKKAGACKASNKLKISYYGLFYYEEPVISNKKGSGAIFFTNCNLKCIFCQNYEISTENKGKYITITKLKDIMLELQNKGAKNINLVTPTIYVPSIIKAINKAKKEGLNIPIIYNTSSYENINTIELLKNKIDVYLPDLKYYSNELAIKYSNAKDYFKIATEIIKKMYDNIGPVVIKNGYIKKGVIVRHLLLPGHLEDSKKIIKYLYDTYKDNIYISIMNQYTPIRKLEYKNLNRNVTEEEYNELVLYAYNLGIRNSFVQIGETQDKSFIPNFSDYYSNK